MPHAPLLQAGPAVRSDQVAQDFAQPGFIIPQGWSLPSLPVQDLPVLMEKVSVPSLKPSHSSPCCRALSTPAVKGPAASSPSPPLGLRGVCEVPPKPSLPRLDQPQPLLRGQAPAPSTAGVTSRRVIGVFLHQGTKLLVPRCALTASAGHRGPAPSSSLCSCCGSPRCCCLPLLPAPAQLAGPVRVCICTLVFHIS